MAKRQNRRSFDSCAVLYLRYSTHNQTDLSIAYQREKAGRYCNEKGYTIVGEYIDEAQSGTTDKREAFQRMIADAQNKPQWQKIVVFSFSRFARNTDENGYYKVVLWKQGITVESAIEDNADTPEARLMRNMSAAYDAYMPEKCAAHTHAALDTKARKCQHCGGKPPLGYDIKDEKLVVNKQEAETVRLIFEMYDKNYSYNEMIRALEEQGRTTKNGSPFKKSSLHAILKQEKYKGTFVWNKAASRKNTCGNNRGTKPVEEQVRIEGGCKAIVETELFDRVQAIMQKNQRINRRSSGKYHYMFGGMKKVVCAECGSCMVGAAYKSHGKSYRYYECPNHKKRTCNNKNLRASRLEHMVSTYIVNTVLTKSNHKEYNALLEEMSGGRANTALHKELAGVKKAIGNLLRVLETSPTEEVIERLDLLKEKKESIQQKLAAAERVPKITAKTLKTVRTALFRELKNSSDLVVYDILDQLIDKITVGNDTVTIELQI